MPVQSDDVEMAKPSVITRGPRKPKRKKGQYFLPLMIGACFVALFLFFVLLRSGSSGHDRAGDTKLKGAAGGSTNAWGAALQPRPDGQPRVFTFDVVNEFPHDPQAFTQGLQYDKVCEGGARQGSSCRDVLWESTGLKGRSTVREVELTTGKVLRSKKLPQEDFGEGVTRHGDRLYQVTWMSGKAWSYSAADFEDARQEETPLADGWGITSDGQYLVVGDSSERLTWVDPASGLKSVRQVAVKDGDTAVRWLNELEWVEGMLWANIWHTDCIAQIDPGSGRVLGWALLAGLRARAEAAAAADAAAANRKAVPLDGEAVLNGIAFDGAGGRLFVTGKLWPRLYQLQLREVAAGEAAAALRTARQHCIVGGRIGR